MLLAQARPRDDNHHTGTSCMLQTLQDSGLTTSLITFMAEACKLILLVQPSSAAAEFCIFSHQRRHSLEDYVSLSVNYSNVAVQILLTFVTNFAFLSRIPR